MQLLNVAIQTVKNSIYTDSDLKSVGVFLLSSASTGSSQREQVFASH